MPNMVHLSRISLLLFVLALPRGEAFALQPPDPENEVKRVELKSRIGQNGKWLPVLNSTLSIEAPFRFAPAFLYVLNGEPPAGTTFMHYGEDGQLKDSLLSADQTGIVAEGGMSFPILYGLHKPFAEDGLRRILHPAIQQVHEVPYLSRIDEVEAMSDPLVLGEILSCFESVEQSVELQGLDESTLAKLERNEAFILIGMGTLLTSWKVGQDAANP